MYCKAVKQYIDDGHAQPLEDDRNADNISYIPRHAVFWEDRETTNCWVVFDSSSSAGVSLNSCLLKGPKLQLDIGHVIIRFRFHPVGLTADIKNMFLQITLKCQDQNTHAFTISFDCHNSETG